MRTSNYIVAAFLVVAAGVTLGMFITAKYYTEKPLNTQTYALPDFSVVVAENGARFTIKQNEENTWVVSYKEGEAIPEGGYRIEGDTLYVPAGPSVYGQTLHVANLPLIVALEESHVGIKDVHSGDLFIEVDRARLYVDNYGLEAQEGVLNIWIVATDASVSLSNVHAGSIRIASDNSKITMYSGGRQVEVMEAQLLNNSTMRAPSGVSKLIIDKDNSSKFTAY
jgi:hypothetical protein